MRVTGGNSYGTSAASNEVQVVVGGSGGCAVPPDAPLLAVPNVSGNQVTFAWTAAAGGCPATTFTLQAGSAPSLANITAVNVGATTSFAASAPAGTYYVRVVGNNVHGVSGPSSELPVVIAAPPSWSMSGTSSKDFDMPRTVKRVRIIANFVMYSANFIVVIDGKIVVNQTLGTAPVYPTTHYDAFHDTTGGPVKVLAQSGVIVPGGLPWSITEVP